MRTETDPGFPYILLRASQELFQKAPSELDEVQHGKALAQAERASDLEERILCSPEAAGVVAPEEQTERAVAEIAERYPDSAAFEEDLARNGLDPTSLRLAIQRQCRVDNVLEKIGAGAPRVSDVDVSLFYHAHLERFRAPETREVFHILVSINEDFAENTRTAALERIETIGVQLMKKPRRFSELAQRHSECPTALDGGRIGLVKRGQLYSALDEALFAMPAGEIRGPIESPMGLHFLRCGTIQPCRTLSLKDATPGIRRHLAERYRDSHCKQWIAHLPGTKDTPASNS
jgi:nitrogen fixation protein NifM